MLIYCRSGNEEAVRLLLCREDIDVNFQSRHGENALIESVTYRRYEIAKTLASRPDCLLDIVDERDRTPLIMAAQYG
jgi:ankyrin repeat protein